MKLIFPRPETLARESGITMVPHIFFDKVMCNLSHPTWKVLCVFIRKLYGWQKDADIISESQIHDMTGLGERTIRRSISRLLKGRFILRLGELTPNGWRYKLNTDKWITLL